MGLVGVGGLVFIGGLEEGFYGVGGEELVGLGKLV